jgi:hypothetical protein
MTNPIDELQPFVSSEDLVLSATEINGFITGMLCGGLSWQDEDCQMNLQQVLNEGDALSADLLAILSRSFKDTKQQMVQGLLQWKLAIEDNDNSLGERLKSLSLWSEAWLLGYGHGLDSGKATAEAIEVLSDIKNISQVDFELAESEQGEEDESMEKAYVDILEHLKVSVEMLFLEKQQALLKAPKPQTSKNIH